MYTVVGVLPAGFTLGDSTDVWTPIPPVPGELPVYGTITRVSRCCKGRMAVPTQFPLCSAGKLLALNNVPSVPLFPVRGQVGTVVEMWAPGVYEVEFADDRGKTYAMVALRAEQTDALVSRTRSPSSVRICWYRY
jgi:hypothetical protein